MKIEVWKASRQDVGGLRIKGETSRDGFSSRDGSTPLLRVRKAGKPWTSDLLQRLTGPNR